MKKSNKGIEERLYNSKKHTFFWHLMNLKNLQEKVLDKNRSELRKKGIENIAELLLRIGERYKRLACYGSFFYP